MIGKRAAEAAQAMDAAGDYETLGRLLSSRYSCRGFLPEPVPREDIERILAVAQRTASWCNAQPWQVVVTSGDATERFRRRLLEGAREPVEADKPDFAWPRRAEAAKNESAGDPDPLQLRPRAWCRPQGPGLRSIASQAKAFVLHPRLPRGRQRRLQVDPFFGDRMVHL